ncbi:MAG: YtoQ family protein [Phycisphaeraceae bacterium]|jgi:YtoQ family protein|nr:YtoQ family protein [Phycisphaeraceae bacterium]
MGIRVYLAGEIHSNWRTAIVDACSSARLAVSFMSPISDHGLSDRIGTDILGEEADAFWKDHKSAKINTIRTRTMIEKADVVVAKFSEDYRQWNTALDVGYAAAKGKPIIVLHPDSLVHPLKEVDAAAMAVAETPEQVARILQHVVMKQDGIDS